jgi:hypothetical protein
MFRQIARGKALRIFDVLEREAPVNDMVIDEFKLLANERAGDTELVREVIERLAAALSIPPRD